MDVDVDGRPAEQVAVVSSKAPGKRWGLRSISLALAATVLTTVGALVALGGPAQAGDTAWRDVKYLDCWISERAFTNGLGGEIGYAATIYVEAVPIGSHRNPSDCRLKMQVYFDHPPAHTAGNKIFIAPMTAKNTYVNTLTYGYRGEPSIKLLKVTMYACKAACSDGVTYPSLS